MQENDANDQGALFVVTNFFAVARELCQGALYVYMQLVSLW